MSSRFTDFAIPKLKDLHIAYLTRKLNRKPIKGDKLSLREIAQKLFEAGHVTSKGTAYGAGAIARMLK